ncbi:MAG TPA: hypothetical protein VGB73_14590 [Pyrinomonadaceae bacterium]|jgi:hypothetical protein
MSWQRSEASLEAGNGVGGRAARVARVALAALLLSIVAALGGCAGEKQGASALSAVPAEIDLTTLSPGGSTTAFYVDLFNSKPWKPGEVYTVPADSPEIVLNGWAIDFKHQRPASGVFVNVDGRNDTLVSYGDERRDVVAYFEDEKYLKTGFTARLAAASLGKGRHALRFKVVSADRREYFVPAYKVEIDVQ